MEIEKSTLPIVYRFRTTSKAIDLLKDQCFYLANPNQFNDPFDNYVHVIKLVPSKEKIKKLISGSLDNHQIPRADRRKVLRRYLDDTPHIEALTQETFQNVFNETGICCFSEKNDNILLWSHYSDSHTGVALGFDLRQIKFPIYKMAYKTDFEKIDYFKDRDTAVNTVLTTKSKDWEYEKEIRIIRPKSGKLAFEKEYLKEVIFGCKISENDEKEIKKVIKSEGYNVIFKKMFQSKKSFSLEIKGEK